MALAIIQLNTNGIRNPDKRAGLLQWLRSLSVVPDVVCLQETHCVSDVECQSWFRSSGFHCVVSPGSQKSCGCIILFRPCLSLVNFSSDDSGRFVLCEFRFQGKLFRVVSLYAPNRNPARDQFLDQVSSRVDPAVPTVICGDFNTVFDRSLDRTGSVVSDTSRESTSILSRLFDDCCVIDIWRYLHPSSSGYTWMHPDGSVFSRIDLVGCPYVWVPSVSSCEIVPCPFSDHCAVLLCVAVPDVVPPGPGLWKLNTSILEESDYVCQIENLWSCWRDQKERFPSLAKWWEAGKSRIKGLSINYCCARSSDNAVKRGLLSRLASHLKERVDIGVLSLVGPYQSVLQQLAALDVEVAKGAQVRARARWIEEGETSSSYFFRLEKKRGSDRWIAAVRNDDGQIVASPEGLCSSFSAFYSSLFTAEPTDPIAQESLLRHIESSLPPAQSESCEGLLSVEECSEALSGMAKRKAPGLDGLPAEFYLKLWHVLGHDLVDVLNSCYVAGSLTLSQRRGIISLSFKKGDRLDMRNWRPISLLNVDYKLAARAIAGRLLKVIHLVVAEDQTCGVPGRYIGENVALLRDVVSYATMFDSPVAILSLDQEKAFDRVDWSFMYATLRRMGFGTSFLQWVNLFYTGVQSSVNVNGYLSPFFSLSRGVRQGCPLSPLLYVLVAEVLACNIRANPRIKGLCLPGQSDAISPISQYADDTSLVVCSDDAIRACFNVYDLYERGSGSRLNLSKSKGLWLGPWANRSDPPVGLDWSSTKIKVLGVFLGPGNLDDDNWKPRIEAVENTLLSWRQRILSFEGRALVINALALSRVWYVASLIRMPPWVFGELLRLVFSFFWKGKKDLVSRLVVVQAPSVGGFSVVDVKLKVQSLLVQWVRRFVMAQSSWSVFVHFWFFTVFNSSPVEVFSRPFAFSPRALPPFYQSLLLAWRAVDGSFSQSRAALVMASSDPHQFALASAMTAKSAYLYLLSANFVPPHCEEKFLPLYGSLYWSATWRQLGFCPVDRAVIDVAWQVAHGVLYTADRLISFGYDYDPNCFCGSPETPSHLFFECALAQSVLGWIQSLMFRASSLCPSLLVRHVLFGFSASELVVVPRVFVYLLNLAKYFLWRARNDFRFRDVQPGALPLIEVIKARAKCHLCILFKRFRSSRRQRYFHRQWGGNGVVGRVSEGSFYFRL